MGAVYRWELRKLRAQKRTYLGLGAAVLVPVAFVVALAAQNGAGPTDVPLGRALRDTGLAIPFVVLFFMSIWGLPLVTALVAGDIVAAESHNGTLKTILTRSRDRGEIFAGKACAAATYTIVALCRDGAVGVTAGVIEFGWHPLVSLSGTKVAPLTGLGLLAAEQRRLCMAAARDRGLRHPAVDRDPQQRGVGRRDADVRPIDAAPRCAAGHRGDPPLPARKAVLRLARLPAQTDRLGTGGPRRLALRSVRRCTLFAGYLVFLRRDVTGD